MNNAISVHRRPSGPSPSRFLKHSKGIKAYGKLAEDGCKALPFGATLKNNKIVCQPVSVSTLVSNCKGFPLKTELKLSSVFAHITCNFFRVSKKVTMDLIATMSTNVRIKIFKGAKWEHALIFVPIQLVVISEGF